MRGAVQTSLLTGILLPFLQLQIKLRLTLAFQQSTAVFHRFNEPLFTASSSEIIDNVAVLDETAKDARMPRILPARQSLQSFLSDSENDLDDDDAAASLLNEFSILSWNILLPNSQDNWWNHKMYASWVPEDKRQWSHRQNLIKQRLEQANADIVCLQEADGDTFQEDFAFMKQAGYEACLHKKFRFRCATFYKKDKFQLYQEAHKDRTLVTELRSVQGSTEATTQVLHVVNCHLSGGAAPERRLRQVHEALDQIRKWKNKKQNTLDKQRKANRPSPQNIQKAEEDVEMEDHAGIIVCGDFNSDGDTAVRRFLVEGHVDPDWREPQYPNVPLTSKRKQHVLNGTFVDAAELAYAANVCDGDYGEMPEVGSRPATYVVPNLASMLLLPVQGQGHSHRTQFGHQVAKGLADTLGLCAFDIDEVHRAFESIDLDGNNVIDRDEVQKLLNAVYMSTYRRNPTDEERESFLKGFQISPTDPVELSREHLTEKIMALQQELEGGSEGAELVEIRTESDAQRMIARFSPILKDALDHVFESFSSDGGESLTQEDVNKFLVKANGQLGRGGTSRHTAAVFNKKMDASEPAVLSRHDWYGVFARELGEGKWWQVVYDLEICGANLRSKAKSKGQHYQGWLDYVYFDSRRLACTGVQESLSAAELSRIYDQGDALPNEWHPSDHLPIAALFSWR